MKITAALKKWLVDNCDVKADATDDEYKAAAADAIVNGKLTSAKLSELQADPDEKEANEFSQKMDQMADSMAKLAEALTKEPEKKEEAPPEKKEEKAEEKKEAPEKKEQPPSDMAKMMAAAGIADPAGKDVSIRVKEAAEMYSDTKKTVVYGEKTNKNRRHHMAGQPVKNEFGHTIEQSDRDKAVVGAYWKFLINSTHRKSRKDGFRSLHDHDRELVLHAMEHMKFGGMGDGDDNRKLYPHEKQALIDDGNSGGTEAVPIVFDDDVISTPLLHGELFPKVKLVPLSRGGLQGVEGVATGQVTWTWGGVDNTAIALFNTALYVTAFDTDIFRAEGSIRFGLDFLSDTPIDFGAHISAQYGQALLETLDNVIATGNGTTQPQGVMNAAGVTTVAWGGATSIGNYESLRFGVAKPEHTAQNMINTAVFCGTEVSYQRVKALPVGAADDRRLFGTGNFGTNGYDNYSIMDRPYAINESLANTQVFYAILGRYRMYKRRGLTLRTSTEGDTLMRRNLMLMVVTARYGGQLERGAAAAVTTTAPA
jgi:HK97 family phage major capsid protein